MVILPNITLTLALLILSSPRQAGTEAQVSEELRAAQLSLQVAEDEVRERERMNLDAEEKEQRYRRLLDAGLVARNEWRKYDRAAKESRELLELSKIQASAAKDLVGALEREYELARAHKIQPGYFSKTRLVSRFYGNTSWSADELNQLSEAFRGKFGKSLPISALGQTATHDDFHLDHRGRVDVAVFPDSVEGEWLLDYLRSRGISFLAFRASVPGEATGPHIHIGPPSHRL